MKPFVDVCVMGAGPAGSALAARLARLGLSVILADRRGDGQGVFPESVAPSIEPALAALGLRGFPRLACEARRIRWSDEEPREHRSGEALIDRRGFDALVRERARDEGAKVLGPASVRATRRSCEGWQVTVETASSAMRIGARFLADARGRRRGGSDLGAPTVALCGRWRGATPRRAQTATEAAAHAWLWGAPATDGSYALLAFVEACALAGKRAPEREAVYRALCAGSALFSWCTQAELIELAARDATPRTVEDCVDAQSVTLGDACLAMDPIASQGLQAALRSALQASAVIHTILGGGDAEAAAGFYRQSRRRTWARHRRAAATVYSQARFSSPFWRMRAEGHAPSPLVATAARAPQRLRLSPDAQLLGAAVMNGDRIERRRALVHPSLDDPVAWLDGVELAPLLEPLREAHGVAELEARWSRELREPGARRLLDWLTGAGVLVEA